MISSSFVPLMSFLLVCLVHHTKCHGSLARPPGRSTAWRFNHPTPVNYNDAELNCGGVGVQYQMNGGKCGVCGDPWDKRTPRDNELGGKFGTGYIVQTYKQGDIIEIAIAVTINHLGYFEFKICNLDDNYFNKEGQDCFDKHPLVLVQNNSTRHYMNGNEKFVYLKAKLPSALACKHCVLQWHWYTGNSWGDCLNGQGGQGCGKQEVFRGCADIAVYPSRNQIFEAAKNIQRISPSLPVRQSGFNERQGKSFGGVNLREILGFLKKYL